MFKFLFALAIVLSVVLPGAAKGVNIDLNKKSVSQIFTEIAIRQSGDPHVCEKGALSPDGIWVNPPLFCYSQNTIQLRQKLPNMTKNQSRLKDQDLLSALDGVDEKNFWKVYKLYKESSAASYEELLQMFPQKDCVIALKASLEQVLAN